MRSVEGAYIILQRGSQLVYYALLKGGAGIHPIKGIVFLNIIFFLVKIRNFKIFYQFSEPKWYAGEDVVFLGVL